MKVAAVIRAGANRVDGRIDKTQTAVRRGAIRDGLLVDQGHEARPAWRRKAGPGQVIDAPSVPAGEVIVVAFHGNVRHITLGGGSFVLGIGNADLPARDWDAFADATRAAVPRRF